MYVNSGHCRLFSMFHLVVWLVIWFLGLQVSPIFIV